MLPPFLKIKIKIKNDEKAVDEVESKSTKMSVCGGSGSGGAAAAPLCCMVESCGTDLRGCKKYYLKHKVCEVHAKAPVVLLAGFRQRFCQQCSRFHEVSEFDQEKRSCRRRLAGHNERRRKRAQEELSRLSESTSIKLARSLLSSVIKP